VATELLYGVPASVDSLKKGSDPINWLGRLRRRGRCRGFRPRRFRRRWGGR
jgi:hypothetical protein